MSQLDYWERETAFAMMEQNNLIKKQMRIAANIREQERRDAHWASLTPAQRTAKNKAYRTKNRIKNFLGCSLVIGVAVWVILTHV